MRVSNSNEGVCRSTENLIARLPANPASLVYQATNTSGPHVADAAWAVAMGRAAWQERGPHPPSGPSQEEHRSAGVVERNLRVEVCQDGSLV